MRAAMELFAERGYDATTVADIAAAAEVAPRTVAMYFPSKQDIAMSRFSEVVGTLTDALRHRGPDERVTEIVQRWLRAGETGEDGELKELAVRMYAVNPELDALRTARMAEAITAGAEAVAAEAGLPPDAPGPRIAAVAAAAVLIELTDIPAGAERDRAAAVALRFLQAGVATLRS